MNKISAIIAVLVFTISISAQSLLPLYKKGTISTSETLSIKGEGDGYMLNQAGKLVIGKNGKIYVLNSGENCILIFNEKGQFEKKFSKAGSGPGEINMCYKMELTPDGNLVTFDYRNSRFTFFSPEGNFIKSVKPKTFRAPWTYFLDKNENVYVQDNKPDFQSKESGTMVIFSKFDKELSNAKEIFKDKIFDNVYKSENGMNYNIIMPFSDNIFFGVQPSGNFVIASAKDYNIQIFNPDGQKLNSFTHKTEKVKVTEKDKEEFFKGMTFSSSDGGEQQVPKHIKDNTVFPNYKAAFDNMKIDEEGNILLRTERKDGDNVTWEVFSKDGKFVNNVKMNKKLFNYSSTLTKGALYQLEEDEEGFQVIKKYNLK